MIARRRCCFRCTVLVLVSLFPAGCTRAPSFDIEGSLFPAWLACFILAVPLTVAARWLLLRQQIPVAWPVLTYPSLVALFTLALWLAFFR